MWGSNLADGPAHPQQGMSIAILEYNYYSPFFLAILWVFSMAAHLFKEEYKKLNISTNKTVGLFSVARWTRKYFCIEFKILRNESKLFWWFQIWRKLELEFQICILHFLNPTESCISETIVNGKIHVILIIVNTVVIIINFWHFLKLIIIKMLIKLFLLSLKPKYAGRSVTDGDHKNGGVERLFLREDDDFRILWWWWCTKEHQYQQQKHWYGFCQEGIFPIPTSQWRFCGWPTKWTTVSFQCSRCFSPILSPSHTKEVL